MLIIITIWIIYYDINELIQVLWKTCPENARGIASPDPFPTTQTGKKHLREDRR